MEGSELLGSLCAAAICLGTWSVMVVGSSWLAGRRVRRIEDELGARAEPQGEWPLAWYAGASIAWPFAAVLAIVGLARRTHVRVGRNCLHLLLAHFSVATLAAIAIMVLEAGGSHRGDPVALVGMACAIVGFGATVSTIFVMRFASARTARIEVELPSGDGVPAAARIALYLASAIFWPAGFVLAAVYSAPENVRVAMMGLRFSAIHLCVLSLLVCAGLLALVASL